MEVEFDVNINAGVLYDYMLHHTYSSFSGILGTIVGLLLIVAFFVSGWLPYLIFGIVVTFYLPWTLFLKSKQQMLRTEAFHAPLHYKMSDEGIEVSQGEVCELQTWDNMFKAISTGKSIIVYTSPVNASIYPRKDLKEKAPKVIEMISTHMDPKKVKIRA